MVRYKIIITARHHPRVSTLCLPDITAYDQISQAFPLCVCILQNIEGGNALGMKLCTDSFSGLSDYKLGPVVPRWSSLNPVYDVCVQGC